MRGEVIRLYLRLGRIAALNFAVLVLAAVLVYDTLRAAAMGIDPWAALRLCLPAANSSSVLEGLLLFLALYLGVPMCVGLLRVVAPQGLRLGRLLSSHGRLVTSIHLSLCVITAMGLIYSHYLEMLAGYRLLGASKHYALQTQLVKLIGARYVALGLLGFILTVAVGYLLENAFEGKAPDWIAALNKRAKLLDLRSEFYPEHGRHRLNFNAGSVAPVVEGVKKRMTRRLRQYQASTPGSVRARELLRDEWRACQDAIGRLLDIEGPSGLSTGMVTSTSRALEVAILACGDSRRIVLSPYEHPTEERVTGSSRVLPSGMCLSTLFDMPWQKQAERVANRILEAAVEAKPLGITVVLSEVCWATGMQLKLQELIALIQRGCSDLEIPTSPSFVVNGAHAVGNLRAADGWRYGDAYIFSGHKWLLSPEPSGLLLTRRPNNWYDCWVDGVPYATVGPSPVCGLRAAIEVVEEIGTEERFERAAAHRDLFLTLTGGDLEVVGDEAGLEKSCMIALRPSPGKKWRVGGTRLRNLFESRGICLLVLDDEFEIPPAEAWVRVCFQYFHEPRAVERLVRDLKQALQ